MPWGHFPASVSVPSKFRLKYLDWFCQVYRTSNVPSPSSCRPLALPRAPGAAAVGSHGLCPAGFTQPVPKGLKVQGSGSPISLMTPHPVGGRMRVSGFLAGSARRSRGSLPGDSCGALWAVPGQEPELPRIPLPVPPSQNVPGGGRVRFSTCAPESAAFANKSFWLWRSSRGLGCPRWARPSGSRAQWRGRSGLWEHGSCLPLTVLAFLFSGKVAAVPVELLSRGLAGELASCPGSAAGSF